MQTLPSSLPQSKRPQMKNETTFLLYKSRAWEWKALINGLCTGCQIHCKGFRIMIDLIMLATYFKCCLCLEHIVCPIQYLFFSNCQDIALVISCHETNSQGTLVTFGCSIKIDLSPSFLQTLSFHLLTCH